MIPRIELTSVIYALHAGGSDSSNYAQKAGEVSGTGNVFPGSSNVGIGTTAPEAKLHIGGTPGVDGIKFPDGSLQTTASTSLWSTSGTAINYNSGYVGIGITAPATPAYQLDVQANVAGDYVASIINSGLGANAGSGLLVSVSDTTIGGGGNILSVEGQGNSYLTVTASGNVGIGTATPSYLFEVKDTTSNGEYSAYINRTSSSSSAKGLNVYANAYNAGSADATAAFFEATGGISGGTATGLQINTSSYGTGQVRGLSSSNYSNGTGTSFGHYLTASGYGADTYGLFVRTYGYGTNVYGIWVDADAGSAPNAYAFYGASGDFYMNGYMGLGTSPSPAYRLNVSGNSLISGNLSLGTYNPAYKLYVNGNTMIMGGAWIYGGIVVASDRRWKKNITTLAGSLEKVLKLRGVTYEWRTDEFADMNFSEGVQIGVIAQELESVYPELVSTTEEGYKGVAYDKLTAVIIEAVKELAAEKDALQQQVAAQQGEIAQLQQKMARVETLLESADLASRD